MASPVAAQVILCDAAQADAGSGKVHMLGAGWSMTRTPSSHAVAVLLKIPWDRANEPITLTMKLLDADGHPAQLLTPTGIVPAMQAEGKVEVGRPAGIAPGSLLDASFVLNVPPLPLAPGRYEWRLEVGEASYTAPFTVLP
ncbi:MAG TPA: hypothetical protein VH561_12570 [Micromonosporaceae bacterium]|jgi:hypothetical protein